MRIARLPLLALLPPLLAAGLDARPAEAQWSTVYEQTYLPASHNWSFRRNYTSADRLFNAFDYGHAILYETLYRRHDAPESLLEEEIYDHLTRRVLVRPPRLPLEEAAIEVAYAKLVPEAKMMFDWAHILHRQTYDVWADERIPPDAKDAHMAEILAYYRTRPDIAFSSQPKSMELMDGQHYSLAFRERFPKFNGLIWAYHWLQVGLYEPLLVGRNADERQALVRGTVARFWQMLENPPETMPYLMPMTAAVAPSFAARYPEIAIIFDNLHMMHDVVSDILASPVVPRDRKRAEIMRAVDLFRDNTSYVTTVEEWRQMATGMGLNNQGGPAVGFLSELPIPTVPRGMSMAGMEAGQMDHGAHGDPPAPAQPAQDPHAGHVMPGAQPQPAAPPEHAGHGQMHSDDMEVMHRAMEFIVRLLADPQVESRIHATPRLHELWEDPALQRMLQMLRRMHAPDAGADAPAQGGAAPAAHAGHAAGAGAADSAGLAKLMSGLLADPRVQERISQDAELRALWSDPAVREHMAMAPQMVAGMTMVMELIQGLVSDPAVQARIESDPALRELWRDAAVRNQIGGHQH
jgi:hypothetical protein